MLVPVQLLFVAFLLEVTLKNPFYILILKIYLLKKKKITEMFYIGVEKGKGHFNV